MAWYAKPSGPYSISSAEGTANVEQINGFFNGRAYSLEAQAGVIGNIMAEGGLNPWRWQSDKVSLSGGYGLFQYTPARSYINGATTVEGYGPNQSVTAITPGARPEDGYAQLIVFADNTLGKWVSTCWRNYWEPSAYPELYALRQQILNTFGDGSHLSMAQFAKIDIVYDATFAFLACFEGPAVPNMETRYINATAAYKLLTGDVPPEPPGPGPSPGPGSGSKLPLIYYTKLL